MAWTNLTYTFGSLLTASKMTQLFDNLNAMATGATGAPQIQTAGIADGAITNAKLAAGTSPWTNYVHIFDDFTGVALNTSAWATSAYAVSVAAERNGTVTITSSGAVQGIFSTPALKTAGNIISFSARVRGGNTGVAGLMAVMDNYTVNPCIGFYVGAANHWFARTRNTSNTDTDTGIVCYSANSYQRLSFTATQSQVTFAIDGIVYATHTTQINTSTLLGVGVAASTSSTIYCDYVEAYTDIRL